VADGLVEMMADLRAGRFARTADVVERVTGLPPRTFEGWYRAHVGAFRRAPGGGRSARPRGQRTRRRLRVRRANVLGGFLAGLLCSVGGAMKDTPHEGFKPLVFLRSTVVGTVGGAVSAAFTTNFLLAFAFAGYFERFVVEGWKIVRGKKPGKFERGAGGLCRKRILKGKQ
jgi:hypothetical protein